MITTIKDELERRLAGAVGGVEQVVEALGTVGLAARKRMLSELAGRDPQSAAEVRRRIFLDDDIGRLSDRDLSVLISNFRIETLASAFWTLAEDLKERIKGQMAEKTWLMLEQTLKYGAPTREKSERAVEELVALALKLVSEGKIRDPLENDPRLLEKEAAPAAAAEAAPPPPPPPAPGV